MPHPGPASRPGKLLLGFLALVLFNSFFLADFNRLPIPPREMLIAFFYEGNVLLHLMLGIVALILVVRMGGRLRRLVFDTAGAGRLAGVIMLVGLVVCMAAGIGLLVFGNFRPQANILLAHGLGALAAALGGVLWLMARSRQNAVADVPVRASAASTNALIPRRAAALIACFLVPG